MALKPTIYRVQLFSFQLISSMLVFQYSLLMKSRGVSTITSLSVFSVSQIVILLATFGWGKVFSKAEEKNRWIQVSLIIRILVNCMMFFIGDQTIFILLFLLYNTVSSSIDVSFEGLVGRWAFAEGQPFGKYRMFASIGYASSGLIASALYVATHNVNTLLLFILIINSVILAGTFWSPLHVRVDTTEKQSGVRFDRRIIFLIILCALILQLANSFGVLLNDHYTTSLNLQVEKAVFFAGVALFLGSCVSEATGFFFVDKLIQKFNPEKIILLGMLFCIVRWIFAFVLRDPVMFTATYLFHGLSFSFIYVGFISYVKERLGESSVTKIVVNFSISATLIGFLFTWLFSILLKSHSTEFILGLYIVMSAIVSVLFFICYRK